MNYYDGMSEEDINKWLAKELGKEAKEAKEAKETKPQTAGFHTGGSGYSGGRKQETEASAEDRDFGVTLTIDDEVFRKVMHWVNKSEFEVSGLGSIIYDKEKNILRVVDAILLKQKNTPTFTEIEATAIGKAMYELRNAQGEMRWWWHSHVNMGVFWSGTDLATIKQLGGEGWFAATVFNKRNEVKSAFCQNAPIRILLEDIKTRLNQDVDQELVKRWDSEYDKHVENTRFFYGGGSQYPQSQSPYWQAHQKGTQETKEAKKADEEGWHRYLEEKYNNGVKPNLVPVEKKTLTGDSKSDFKSDTKSNQSVPSVVGVDEETGRIIMEQFSFENLQEKAITEAKKEDTIEVDEFGVPIRRRAFEFDGD